MRNLRAVAITAVIGLILTITATYFLEEHDHKRIFEQIQTDAHSLEMNIRDNIVRLMYAGELAGELLKTSTNPPLTRLYQLRHALTPYYPAIHHIVMFDQEFNLVEQYSLHSDHLLAIDRFAADHFELARLEELLMSSLLTSAYNLSDDPRDLALFLAVEHQQQRYYFALVINVEELLEGTIRHHIIEGYQIDVTEHGKLIYQFSGNDELKDEWYSEFRIRVADRYWQFVLWPTPLKFSQMHVVNSYIAPITGSLLTLCFIALVIRYKYQEQQFETLQREQYQLQQQLHKREEVELQLAYLSEHDALTEVPNRNALLRFLQERLPELKQQQTDLVAIQINIDHFKQLNHVLGHMIGDELLRRMAHRIKQATIGFEFIARIGGDEFLVIKEGVHDQAHVLNLTEKICAGAAPEFYIDNYEIHTTISLGVAFASDADYDADTLLRHTDFALIEAKRNNYHGVSFYKRSLQSELSKRQYILEQLHRAVERKELEVHYQPIFALPNKTIYGFEALIRWRQSDGYYTLPEDFLPLIEHTGLIIPLTEHLIRQVVDDYRQWHKNQIEPFTLHLNLSAKQLAISTLPELLQTNLQRHNIPSEYLYIDLNEDLYCQLASSTYTNLRKLTAIGVKIGVTGSGLNYNTMQAMQQFAPHLFKISPTLMQDIPHNKVAALLADTLIKLGNTGALQVSAVGVETQQQIDFLLQRGCLYAQGYYLANPMPAEAIQLLLDNQLAADVTNNQE